MESMGVLAGIFLAYGNSKVDRVPHIHSYEHPMTEDPPTRTHMLNAPALFKIITLDNFTTLTFEEVQYSNHTIHEGDLKIAT